MRCAKTMMRGWKGRLKEGLTPKMGRWTRLLWVFYP